MKTITEIVGDTATIRVVPPEKHERLAALLIEAAGDRKREVKSISTGGRGFRVPLDIAEDAGLVSYEIVITDDENDSGQAETQFAEGGVIPDDATAVNDTDSPIAVQTAEERDQTVPGPAEFDVPAPEPGPADATPVADDSPAEETAEEPAKPVARKSTSRAKSKPTTKAADENAGEQA
ncbi:hypothetical protein [Nocardia cerradoensis]|uniref:Uncharacterized protein n=1 Tax=Nocardia cerradoensis TaxID=85688 RepID=A0A231GTF5_9NOCA|nr:hypothetical protein [Nocardia cerradoensis]NKY48027.1 hypothetical protein [Nocardia cerradoensis]OXR39896.1 hypothetical protein B7C42_08042 [Nocardia cerradoensis]